MAIPNARRAAQAEVRALMAMLFRRKMKRDKLNETDARRAAYFWLAEQMGIARPFLAISTFTEEQCATALAVLRPYAKAQPKAQGVLL